MGGQCKGRYMAITKAEMENYRKEGSWRNLQESALEISERIRQQSNSSFEPKLGGGIRLMLAFNHRISSSLDFFVDSKRWISLLSRSASMESNSSRSFYDEGNVFQLSLTDGEIQFIASPNLLNIDNFWNPGAEEASFPMLPPAEIVARKLFYRGWELTAHDLLDWACLLFYSPDRDNLDEPFAKLLADKLDGIEKSLRRLHSSKPHAVATWGNMLTPFGVQIGHVSGFGLDQLDRYRRILEAINNK